MNYTYVLFAMLVSPACSMLYAHNQAPADDIFRVLTEIQYGELLDKITILEIKTEFITDQKKLKNILTELAILNDVLQDLMLIFPHDLDAITTLKEQLYETNLRMWLIEDAIREKEASKSFDEEFIELARSVYITNDKRCAIKREINILLNSPLVEEKSYKAY